MKAHTVFILFKGLSEMLVGQAHIGIKRMGELDQKPFLDACKSKFSLEEAQVQAFTLCSLWQENLKDPDWHPFRVIEKEGKAEVCLFNSINYLFLS